MSRKSKRTSAPVPAMPPPQIPPPPAITSMFGAGTWCPPQSMAPASMPYWLPAGPQHLGMAASSAQGPWCAPPGIGASADRAPTDDNLADSDMQAWGSGSHPPGGFVNFLTSPSPAQAASNVSASRTINVGDEDNDGDCTRTEKRLLWTKEEDLRLVSAWLNNSNDPIRSNYKKNDQYWSGVTAVYNSTTPKNRARQAKQIKDRFGRIKKRVAWFCAAWKEANALWASGESDVNLMDRAQGIYEDEHKKDGPFMFKHCWDVLRKEPKWDAYLERLDEPESGKRKFNDDLDMGQHSPLDDDVDERPIGGKQAKEQRKKKKDQSCIIDLEEDLHKFVDAQKTANESRKEMLEIQSRVSSENLEAKKLAHLAAREKKEAVMLETYRSLLMQDTIDMPEDVRSEHMLALRNLREKLFNKND